MRLEAQALVRSASRWVRTGSMSIILSDEKLQDGLEQVSDTIEFTRFSRQVTLMVSRDYPGENNGEGP